ncbi:MAG: HDOD domain-containing protein [Chitinispirillaceae bacterium]|nr:HDOD domain-containing protein [Chitinispirillaceae bacterium]
MENKQGVNEKYRRIIEQIDNLPALPAIVSRLIKVVNSPDSSADDAAKLIQKDPALTTKMLRLANSAFYGIPRSISSVTSAVVILGFNTIRSFVLSASVMKMFSSPKRRVIDRERFWKHSIVCAMAARIIVRQFIHIRMMDPESAFCAGILHDLGKLIFSEFVSDDYSEVYNYAKQNRISLLEAEEKVIGFTHSQMGRILADKWALPLDLEYSMLYHHEPMKASSVMELIATIHIANTLSHQMGMNLFDNEPIPQTSTQALAILKIDEAEYERISQILKESLSMSNEFLDIMR